MKRLNVKKYDASFQKLASHFHSGNTYLDNFLKGYASLDNGYGKTFIWLSNDLSDIIGYYNIGTGYIEQELNNSFSKIGGSKSQPPLQVVVWVGPHKGRLHARPKGRVSQALSLVRL